MIFVKLLTALFGLLMPHQILGPVFNTSGGSGGTITRVNTAVSASASGGCSTCSLTIPSTGSGHLLVLIYIDTATISPHITSVTGGGTWVAGGICSANNSSQVTNGDMAYALSSTSGATSLSITMSATAGAAFAYYEYSGGTFAIDGSCVTLSNQSAATHQLTPSITTGVGTNDVIVGGLYTTGFHFGSTAVTGTGWTATATGIPSGTPMGACDDALNVSHGTYQASFSGFSGYGYASAAIAFHD